MQSLLIKSISSLLATVLGTVLLVAGVPTTSNAEPVADYLYKCSTPDSDQDAIISKGDSLRKVCPNAIIKVYQNGSLIDRYQTTAEGVKNRKILGNRQTADCLIAVFGAVGTAGSFGGVLTVGKEAFRRIGSAALAGLSLKDCRA